MIWSIIALLCIGASLPTGHGQNLFSLWWQQQQYQQTQNQFQYPINQPQPLLQYAGPPPPNNNQNPYGNQQQQQQQQQQYYPEQQFYPDPNPVQPAQDFGAVSTYQEVNLKSSNHQCKTIRSGRVFCGSNNITEAECWQLGCCYDTTPGLEPCFYHPDMENMHQPAIPASDNILPAIPQNGPNSQNIVPPVSGPNNGIVPPLSSNNIPISPAVSDDNLAPLPAVNQPPQLPDFLPTSQNPPQNNIVPQLSTDNQGNVLPPQTNPGNMVLPSNPSTSKIGYNGCLLHCTSIPAADRKICVPGVKQDTCNMVGCCFDQVTEKCYHPNQIKDKCPSSEECKLPIGPLERCGAPGITETMCAIMGCCYNSVSGVPTCYRKQAVNVQMPLEPMEPNPQPAIPSPQPAVPTQKPADPTTKPTDATPETTTKFDLLAKLKELQAQMEGGSTIAATASTAPPTQRPAIEQFEISPKAAGLVSKATPTEPASTTNPPYVPPPTTPPQYRQQCDQFGRCQYVLVPEQTCFPQTCGDPYYTPDTINNKFDPRKIVGGSRAFPFSHPWMVMIQKTEGNRTYICGGTLICKQWIITAAHCLDQQNSYKSTPDLDTSMYKIFVGRWVGWQSRYGRQTQVFKGNDIERMLQHQNFIPGKHRGVITNDIALIKLRKPVRLDNFVQPACLPTAPPTPGEVMFATGWGITRNRGPSPTSLKQVGVEIKSKLSCRSRVPGFEDPPGVICAGGEPNHDTCTGDSGGPLVGRKPGPVKVRLGTARKPVWHVYGLTSIGSPSCNTEQYDRQPALYTDVYYHLAWIKDKTNNCCA